MPNEQDPMIGLTVKDYVLERKLGHGATAVVYLARHAKTKKHVAIKFLSGEYCSQPEQVHRFLNEGVTAASLKHENIIHVLDSGQVEDAYFMVMEYIKGVDLSYFFEVQHAVKESQVIPWLKQAALAMSYAHAQGIVHRDLKPANIMLTEAGVLKIADLGLSKNMEAKEESSMTMSGTTLGTPYYISPEQARNAKHVDLRTDIYSLGATFYHLITGVPPFHGDSGAEVMAKHMNEPLVQPQRRKSTIGDGLNDIITKMMEKDVSHRFQNMDELVAAIERLEKGEAVFEKKIRIRTQENPFIDSAGSSPSILMVLGKYGALIAVAVALLFALVISFKGRATAVHRNTLISQKNIPTIQSPPPANSSTTPHSTPLPISTQPTGETEDLHMVGANDSSMTFSNNSFNWVDGFGILAILLGIPVARQVGWFWGSIRAGAFWIAALCIFFWFGDLGGWLNKDVKVPKEAAMAMAYIAFSMLLLLLAWIFTHRLLGHQKETWKFKLNQFVAILPGLVLGGAFAVWFIAFLAVVAGSAFPVDGSWIGSRILNNFPSVEQAYKISKSVK